MNMNIEKILWNILHVMPIRILVMARSILSVSHESNLINMTVEKKCFSYVSKYEIGGYISTLVKKVLPLWSLHD